MAATPACFAAISNTDFGWWLGTMVGAGDWTGGTERRTGGALRADDLNDDPCRHLCWVWALLQLALKLEIDDTSGPS